MKVADRFVIVWGQHSLGSQLWWYFSSWYFRCANANRANCSPLSFVHGNIFWRLQKHVVHMFTWHCSLAEGKGASDRPYRECIILARFHSPTHSDAAKRSVISTFHWNPGKSVFICVFQEAKCCCDSKGKAPCCYILIAFYSNLLPTLSQTGNRWTRIAHLQQAYSCRPTIWHLAQWPQCSFVLLKGSSV